MQKIIENQQFSAERALYNMRDLCVRDCRFAGEEDGESALKECRTSTYRTVLWICAIPYGMCTGSAQNIAS